MEKECYKCCILKDSSKFSKDSSSKDGLQKWCKECTAQWRKNNAENIKQKQRAKYLNERETRLASNREYYRKNSERIIAQKAEYNKANPEVKRKASLKRRVSIAGNGLYLISDKEIQKIYNSPCFYCGSFEKIQADHVIPISRGGSHSIGNLVSCCYKCNPSKGDKTIMEWRKSLPATTD